MKNRLQPDPVLASPRLKTTTPKKRNQKLLLANGFVQVACWRRSCVKAACQWACSRSTYGASVMNALSASRQHCLCVGVGKHCCMALDASAVPQREHASFRKGFSVRCKLELNKFSSPCSCDSAQWPELWRINLVDPASSHMLVSKIKPCMSQYKLLYGETANGSLKQL